ncbi:MAG: transcriptional repressor [Flavobacteriales bacterium]|nr:transcriptional repressor [Flavobacteriales bacterium]
MSNEELLRHHGLRTTALRLDLLRLLQASDRALTHQEFEGGLKVEADRVSIFRSLNAFVEAGVAHRVLDGRGTSCFARCGTDCGHGHHNDTHAHFRCNTCGHVYCMDPIELPGVALPRGFKLAKSYLELDGTCKGCR